MKEYKVRVTGTYDEIATVHAETPESARTKAENYYEGYDDGISVDQLDNVETEIVSVDENYNEPPIDPLSAIALQYADQSSQFIAGQVFPGIGQGSVVCGVFQG